MTDCNSSLELSNSSFAERNSSFMEMASSCAARSSSLEAAFSAAVTSSSSRAERNSDSTCSRAEASAPLSGMAGAAAWVAAACPESSKITAASRGSVGDSSTGLTVTSA